jgi:hypothetical protein
MPMSLGTFSNRAILAGMLALFFVVETIPSARASNSNHHAHSRRKDLARHHLGASAAFQSMRWRCLIRYHFDQA